MFILSQIKAYLAIAAVLGGLSLLGGVYLKGYYAAKSAAEVSVLRDTITNLREKEALQRKASAIDAKAAEDFEALSIALETQVKELTDDIQDPDRVCLDAADVERLRGLGESKAKAK